MRTLLTTLAILIILALTAALVGPMLVDWSARKPLVEAQLSRVLGAQVRIRGDLAVRLLPAPRLEIGKFEVGSAAPGAPAFSARAAHLELALTALLHGEFQFNEASFVEPQLTLVRTAAGGLEQPLRFGGGSVPAMRFEKISARGGRLVILDRRTAARTVLEGVSLDAEANSLLGPFRGNGSLQGHGGTTWFRFSTGKLAGQRLQVKVAVTESGPGMSRIALDGSLVLPQRKAAGGAAPSFVGNVDAVGAAASSAPAWTLSGSLNIDSQHAVLDKLALQVGESVHTIRATGSASISFGERSSAHVSLAAKQIDLDQQFATGEGGVLRPLDGIERLRDMLGEATTFAGRRFPTTVDFSIGAATLGGDIVRDVAGSLGSTPGELLRVKLEARGPAQSRLALDGTYEPGPAGGYKGRLDFAAADRGRFAKWAAQGEQGVLDAADRLLPFKSVAVAGEAEISVLGFVLRDFAATLDRSALGGTVAFTAASGAKRARLFTYVTSEAVDVDALPSLASTFGSVDDLDLSIDLSAKGVRVASIADAAGQSGEVDLKLTRTAGATKLERLRVARLGGASFEARGEFGNRGGHFEGSLDAPDLRGLAALAAPFLPDVVNAAVMARAGSLSPAKLSGSANLTGNLPASIEATGTLGGTRVRGKFSRSFPGADAISADLQVDSDNSGQLLRQLGLTDVKTVRGSGANRIGGTARGRWGGDLDASLNGAVAGAEFSWHGRFAPASGSAKGVASLQSADIALLLRSLGIVADKSPRLPAKLQGDLGFELGQAALTNLSGSMAGVKLGGQVALTSANDPAAVFGAARTIQLTGTLNVDKLALGALTSLILGPPSPVRAAAGEAVWSAQRFAPVPVRLPETRVALRIAALDLGVAVARDAALTVDLAPGVLRLDLQPAAAAGVLGDGGPSTGTLGGAATLRRIGSNMSLGGRLTVSDLALDRPFARGKLNGSIDFVGTGETPLALVAGLAGKGSASLSGVALPGLDAGAIDRVVAAIDAETLPLDAAAVERTLARETAQTGISASRLELPLLLAAGSLQFGPGAVAAPAARVSVSGGVDLTRLVMGMKEVLTVLASPANWRGQPPAVAVVWSGPWKAPKRQVETAAFFSGLSARALAINMQKLADFDADVRERAFFNRRLKIMREEDEHDRRDAAKRAEDERRRQEEELRRKQAAERAAQERDRENRPHPGTEALRASDKQALDELHKMMPLPEVGPPKIPAEPPRPGG